MSAGTINLGLTLSGGAYLRSVFDKAEAQGSKSTEARGGWVRVPPSGSCGVGSGCLSEFYGEM